MPDTPQSTPAAKPKPVKKPVHVDPQQILSVITEAEQLIGWQHLSNKVRASLVGAVSSGVVAVVLAIVQP